MIHILKIEKTSFYLRMMVDVGIMCSEIGRKGIVDVCAFLDFFFWNICCCTNLKAAFKKSFCHPDSGLSPILNVYFLKF